MVSFLFTDHNIFRLSGKASHRQASAYYECKKTREDSLQADGNKMTIAEYRSKLMSIFRDKYYKVADAEVSKLVPDPEACFVIIPYEGKGLQFIVSANDYIKRDGGFTDIDEAVAGVIKRIDTLMPGGTPIGEIVVADMKKGYEFIKPRIVPVLISRSSRKAVLDKVPNRDFYDMHITYRLFYGEYSSLIENDDDYYFGTISEERLYEDAMSNLDPSKMTIEHIDGPTNATTTDAPIYVIKGDYKDFGANALLCNEVLERFANLAGEDFYVFPHSRDELYAIPASQNHGTDLYELNDEYEEKYDKTSFSAHIFVYRKDEGKLEILPREAWKAGLAT